MVALMQQHPKHRSALTAGVATIALVAAMLAALAIPPAASAASWNPAAKSLPSTFSCGATKQSPAGIYHQACLHFANGAVQGAYIVTNRSGKTQRINTAQIHLWSWKWTVPGDGPHDEAWNYCAPVLITNASTRICSGSFATLYPGRAYRTKARLNMNATWSAWDFSPITYR
jgi:hypothetical protein